MFDSCAAGPVATYFLADLRFLAPFAGRGVVERFGGGAESPPSDGSDAGAPDVSVLGATDSINCLYAWMKRKPSSLGSGNSITPSVCGACVSLPVRQTRRADGKALQRSETYVADGIGRVAKTRTIGAAMRSTNHCACWTVQARTLATVVLTRSTTTLGASTDHSWSLNTIHVGGAWPIHARRINARATFTGIALMPKARA